MLIHGLDPDATFGNALLLDPLDLLPVSDPHIKKKPSATILALQKMRGNLPVSHVRHEEDAAAVHFHDSLKVFPPFRSIGNIIEFLKQKPVNKPGCKLMELPPRAPEMISPTPLWKENRVKPQAGPYSEREEKEIGGRNDPCKN